MGGKKKSKKKILEMNIKETSMFANYSAPARNIRKTDLGAVIFGCKHSTINECLTNNLFGLPATHFSYIKNIKEGLVLFLFNYSDRKLHGIFEAASAGEMNINKYAWVTEDDYGLTSYPAQVKVRVRLQCHPLSEEQFGPLIADNYYEKQHFYFELDHGQTKKLISLFTSSPVNSSASSSSSSYTATRCNIPLSSFPAPTKRQVDNVKNLNQIQTSGPSYASFFAQHNSTTTTSSQPTGAWSSLFKSKTQSASEYKADEELDEWGKEEKHEDKVEFGEVSSWENAECVKTWESDWSNDVNTVRDTVPLMEEHEDKDTLFVAETWEESELVDSVTSEAECVQTCVPELITQTNTNTDEFPSSPSQQPLDDIPDRQVSSSSDVDEKNHEKDNLLAPDTVTEIPSTDIKSLVVKLMQEVEVLKGSHSKHITNINLLEQELDKSKLEIQHLRSRIDVLETGDSDNHLSKLSNSVFIFGGFDGVSWLPSLDSYYPSYDIKIPLSHMNLVKNYASASTMNGELYHFGGSKVESYSPTHNQWILRPPSYWNNIHVAGASVNNRLFVVGGCKDHQFSSEVEYLDLTIGKWLPIRSMNSKRSAPTAAEINNAVYVAGGFDGEAYLSSVERLDPREEKWCKLSDMNKRKGCHSMVVLNEKLYTLGGFDGQKYVQMMECFDTRMGSWVECESMNVCRANFGAFVIGEKLYAIGGSKENNQVLDTVECYKEGSCWEVVDVKAIGKRSHFSAIVL